MKLIFMSRNDHKTQAPLYVITSWVLKSGELVIILFQPWENKTFQEKTLRNNTYKM